MVVSGLPFGSEFLVAKMKRGVGIFSYSSLAGKRKARFLNFKFFLSLFILKEREKASAREGQ